MKLKKLARHARLGKLKDNSLAHAPEGCRLLTFNSQEKPGKSFFTLEIEGDKRRYSVSEKLKYLESLDKGRL